MPDVPDWTDFLRIRQNLKDAMAAFETLIAGDASAASAALLRERVRLVQAANAYLAFVSRRIGATGSDPRLQPWRATHDALVALRLRYSEHIARWSATDIGTGWEAYKAGSRALLTGMRAHLDAAERLPPLPR